MNEMHWTVAWFKNQGNIWEQRAETSDRKGQRGHASYAWKQVEMWEKFMKEAEKRVVDMGEN